MRDKEILEALDWEYRPGCQFMVMPGVVCGREAVFTAFVHTNANFSCQDRFIFACGPCMKMIVAKTTGHRCGVQGCDREGVAGHVRDAHLIPVVAS